MAKSKPTDKKAVKADATKALKNGGGKVAKPAEAPKATAKSIAKSAAAKVDSKKSKKSVKAPEPESDSSEADDSEDEEMSDSSASSGSEDESDSDSASEVEAAPKTNGANGTAKKANGVSAKKAQDSDDSSSEDDSEGDSDDEPAAAAAAAEDDDSSEEEDSDDSEDDSEVDTKTNGTNGHKAAAKDDDSEDSEDSDSSEDDEEETAAPQQKKRKAEAEAEPAPKKSKTDDGNRPKNLFIGNLSWNVTEDMLAEEFGTFGEITGCRIVTDRNSGRSKGFGYVEFADADAAAAAHETKKGAMLDGRELNVDFSTPRPEKPAGERQSWQDRANSRGDQVGNPSDTLFLGNLPFNTSNEEIHEAFSQYGTVTRVSLPTDRETGAPKGFGYVSYTSIDEAKAAYEALQGQDYNGRPIRMDYAQPRPENGGGGGGGFGGRGGGRGGGFQRGGRGGGGRGGDRGRGGRGGSRGGRPPSTNRGGFGDFSGQKTTF